MKKWYIVLVAIICLSVVSTTGLAYNNCLSNSTIDSLNNTNNTDLLNDLSNICDRLDVLLTNQINLNSSLNNLTSDISNITDNSQEISDLSQKIEGYVIKTDFNTLSSKVNETQNNLDNLRTDVSGSLLASLILPVVLFVISIVLIMMSRRQTKIKTRPDQPVTTLE